MTKTLAARLVPLAFAAAITIAMLAASNALAGHQYRVATVAAPQLVANAQLVTVVGHRTV